MREKLQNVILWLKERKKYVVASAFILILVVLIGFIFQINQSKPATPLSQKGKAPSPSQSSSETKSPPQVSFSTYDNKAPLPTVPQTVNGYTLKANYSLDEAKEFGTKLGLTEMKSSDPRFVILYNMTDMNSRGILTFDRKTGGISYQSYGIIKPDFTTTGDGKTKEQMGVFDQNPETYTALEFLDDLQLDDHTISCNVRYQRKGLPGVTFVECHRDWSKVGLPILNTVGVLNVPENKSLSSLAVGQTDQYSPDDPSITAVSSPYPPSPSQEGKARPNDFNTITVGVTDDGRILTLESNMRKIVETKQYTSNDLLSPEEALNQFIQHKAQFSLTIPAGSGSVDWSKVYPGNKADSRKAVITDYLLTYLENPGQAPQDKLVPMYIIRGTAELSSGYTVRFMETIPALKSGLSFLPKTGEVAGESTTLVAQNDSSLKLGTFQPDITSSQRVPTGTLITGQPTPSQPGHSSQCADFIQPNPNRPNGVNPPSSGVPGPGSLTLDIPGLGQMNVYNYGNAHAYFFLSASFPFSSVDEVRDAFFKSVEEQYIRRISRWIVQNPTLVIQPPKTIEEVYNLFESIDGANSCSQIGSSSSFGEQLIAPPPRCNINTIHEVNGYGAISRFNFTRLKTVAERVASRMLHGFESGQITNWATEKDLFPEETVNYLHWVFYEVTNYSGFPSLCYISGASPSLYLYPEKEMEVTVSLGGPISYSYPSLSSYPFWEVMAKPSGELSVANSLQTTDYSRLYYEYDKSKVTFTEPEEEFVVKKEEWEGFIRDTLALQLGLTRQEEDDLVTDIKNALSYPPYPSSPSYLKISFASRKELEEKLPVSISPQPDIFHRIHLLLTPLDKSVKSSNPSLQKLARDGFTAVELGASLEKNPNP